MPKSTENTVFVRFVPTPSQKLPRQQLESIFSEVGPIKKTSWIQSETNASKGYGFVKYLSGEDAKTASSSLNGSKISVEGKDYKVLVELATLEQDPSRGKKPSPTKKESQTNDENATAFGESSEDAAATDVAQNEFLKKKSRIIIRNLSFYAKENHIRTCLEKQLGKVVEVHLPRVQSNLHVGFCFVTFADPEIAKRAVEMKSIDIQKRSVTMDWSISKRDHQQQQQQQGQKKNIKVKEGKDTPPEEDKMEEEQDEGNSSDEENDDHDDDGDDDDEEEEDTEKNEDAGNDNDDDNSSSASEMSDTALTEGRTIFLRNLPFDTTRKDVFDLFAKFGYIESIYLVRDKATGMLKGTAFVTFKRSKNAEMAVAAASSSEHKEDNNGTTVVQGGKTIPSGHDLVLKGRKILINMAVDKETADTFASKEHNAPSADRRNMYLQAEARVESTPTDGSDKANTWEDIPEQDQKKRQTALKDKTTKLHSPIFFINPFRLSLRNLAKHVDEIQLRTLCEKGTKKGLQAGLVSTKDHIAHLRAQGDMTTREILNLVQEQNKGNESMVAPWEETKNSTHYIPSVYIDRDMGSTSSKAKGMSRGFGFVEFTHHVHALACLRELNNNPSYSREFVAGGKLAIDLKRKGRKTSAKGTNTKDLRIPRLIVDFTVENRVKAKKQEERRIQQRLNNEKQRQAGKATKSDDGDNTKKRSRGAIQRAKKKLKKNEDGSSGVDQQHQHEMKVDDGEKKSRGSRGAMQRAKKKQRMMENGSSGVDKHQNEQGRGHKKLKSSSDETSSKPNEPKSVPSENSNERQTKSKKRWFE